MLKVAYKRKFCVLLKLLGVVFMLNFKRKRGLNPNLVKRVVSSMLMLGIFGGNVGQVNFASASLSFENGIIADIPPRTPTRGVRFNPVEEHVEDSIARRLRLNFAEEHNPLLRSDIGVNTEEINFAVILTNILRRHNVRRFRDLPIPLQRQLEWELDPELINNIRRNESPSILYTLVDVISTVTSNVASFVQSYFNNN